MKRSTAVFFILFIVILIKARVYAVENMQFAQPTFSTNAASPSLAVANNLLHVTFVSSDSIFYAVSANKGKSFSSPVLVAVLPKLGMAGGRGPQIVSAKENLLIAAADHTGNIYTYIQNKTAKTWRKAGKINDVPDVAKEAFVSLASNTAGEIYAIWLDLRDDHRNKIVGAKSFDGGKTWSKNSIIYKSPDSTVCECCKPSVAMKGSLVAVMFRNWLHGNRDLHIIQSKDGGRNFGPAQKLGEGSWKLNGCPMDGGGLVIQRNNTIQTVWRRQGNIYLCEAGNKEIVISNGRQCVITGTEANTFIAYVNEGKIYCRLPRGNQLSLGNGAIPRLASVDSLSAICMWENNGKIYHTVLAK